MSGGGLAEYDVQPVLPGDGFGHFQRAMGVQNVFLRVRETCNGAEALRLFRAAADLLLDPGPVLPEVQAGAGLHHPGSVSLHLIVVVDVRANFS